MSLILCYCKKCGQHYDISDKRLSDLKNVTCTGCCSIGYFKPVPKEYLKILTKSVGIGEKHLKRYKNIMMSYLKMIKLNRQMFQSV